MTPGSQMGPEALFSWMGRCGTKTAESDALGIKSGFFHGSLCGAAESLGRLWDVATCTATRSQIYLMKYLPPVLL